MSLYAQKRRLLVITTIQAAIICIIGNIIAQTIELRRQTPVPTLAQNDPNVPKSRDEFDIGRIIPFVIHTLMITPVHFVWQQYLERKLPAYDEPDPVRKLEADDDGKV